MVSFLGLPPAVRCQICHHVFPQPNYPIGLSPINNYDAPVNPSTDAGNLLQTCRTVYYEATPLFYSTKHFFVRYFECGDLEVLQKLTPSSMRALRLLTIHLNVSSCEKGAPCCRGHRLLHGHDCDSYHGKPLGLLVYKWFVYAMLF